MPGDIGSGIYAFYCSEAQENSYKFAYKKFKNDSVVLEIELVDTLDNLKIFNLDNPETQLYLNELRNELRRRGKFKNIEKRARKDKGARHITLDGYLIEYSLKLFRDENPGKMVDIVQAKSYTEFEIEKIFQASKIPNGTELCIKNTEVIKDIKILKQE